jgi:hypothetical protein
VYLPAGQPRLRLCVPHLPDDGFPCQSAAAGTRPPLRALRAHLPGQRQLPGPDAHVGRGAGRVQAKLLGRGGDFQVGHVVRFGTTAKQFLTRTGLSRTDGQAACVAFTAKDGRQGIWYVLVALGAYCGLLCLW